MESVGDSRFHDAGPAVVEQNRGELGPAVEGEERGGVKGLSRVIPFCIARIRLRLESESGDEIGHLCSQVGSRGGSRRRA